MNHHKKVWGASAFAALSLIFVFSTGGFSDKPMLRTQVATLEQEVQHLRAMQAAAVNTSVKTTTPQVSACVYDHYCVEESSGECIPCTLIKKGAISRLSTNSLEDIKLIQSALVSKGYLKGVIDGKFGSGTEAAVKAFQKASGLSETGIVDAATSVKLFAVATTPGAGSTVNRFVPTGTLYPVTSPIVTPPVTMSLVSTDSSVAFSGDQMNDDTGVFRVRFKVIAGSSDIYIPNVAAQAVSYTVHRAGSTANLAQGSAVAFGAISGANLSPGHRFRVPAGTTATFELVTIVTLPSAGQAGLYRTVVNGINWATSDTATPTAYPLTTPYSTSYISLN